MKNGLSISSSENHQWLEPGLYIVVFSIPATEAMMTSKTENRREAHTKIDGSPDKRFENNGQGAVKDREHDGRLIENREKGVSMQDRDD